MLKEKVKCKIFVKKLMCWYPKHLQGISLKDILSVKKEKNRDSHYNSAC